MKIVYNTIAFLFCVLTLGFIDLELKYSDGSKYKWVGWITRFQRKRNGKIDITYTIDQPTEKGGAE